MRLEQLLQWLKREQIDIVLLQETKCIDEQFPREAIEELGYNIAFKGQKSYNGVAILSKFPLTDITFDLEDNEEARYIEAIVCSGNKVIRVISVYVPNGQTVGSEKFLFKLKFFSQLQRKLAKLLTYEEVLVIGGDFNVAPEAVDVYDPLKSEGNICFHIDERKCYRSVINLGFSDAFRTLHPNEQQYSWWDYRGNSWYNNEGLRIDHILLSPQAADLLINASMDKEIRIAPKASDHIPVICNLKL
jgi:exodeoxyribonuclease-3